jgi:hypothetical protein
MKILYVVLGDISEEYYKIWKSHFQNVSDKKYLIVNHTQTDKKILNHRIPNSDILINYCINENHIRTKWGGLSVVYASLMAIQYGIMLSEESIDFCVFIPFDCLPLYHFNEMEKILSSINSSKKYYCYPFGETSYDDVINNGMTLPSVAICSQWIILNRNQLYDYYDEELILNKNRLYEKVNNKDNKLSIEDQIKPIRESPTNFIKYHKILREYWNNGKRKNVMQNYITDPSFFDVALGSSSQSGGTYDENFFCIYPEKKTYANIHKQHKDYTERTPEHKKLSEQKKVRVKNIKRNIENHLGLSGINLDKIEKSLIKIPFLKKDTTSNITNVYTYYDPLEKMSGGNCPVYVNHKMFSFGCKAKITSIWINNFKLNNELVIKNVDNELYKELYDLQQAYLELYNNNNLFLKKKKYLEDLENLYNYIKDNHEILNLPEINVGVRDHPVEFVFESHLDIKCALAYFRLLEYISMIRSKKNSDIFIPYDTKYNFINTWSLISGEYDIEKMTTEFNDYINWIDLGINVPKIIFQSGRNTNEPKKFYSQVYYVQYPLYINDHISNALDSGCLFFRKLIFSKKKFSMKNKINNFFMDIQLRVFDSLNKNTIFEFPAMNEFSTEVSRVKIIPIKKINYEINKEKINLEIYKNHEITLKNQQIQMQLQNLQISQEQRRISVPTFEINHTEDKYEFRALNLSNRKVESIAEMILTLENLLNRTIDIVFQVGLKRIKNEHTNYDFVVIGGKNFEVVLGKKNYMLSFDYDIHLLNSGSNIQNFGDALASIINTSTKQTGDLKFFGMYIYNILKKYNFVTEEEIDYYKNESLYYYGTRGQVSINSLFIKLKLRNDLIINKSTNSYHRFYDIDIDIDKDKDNNFYYYFPISDIDHERDINLGIDLSKISIFSDYNSIKYAPYEYVVYNLIQYLCLENRNFKIEKMKFKIDKICNISEYSLDFLLNFIDKKNIIIPKTLSHQDLRFVCNDTNTIETCCDNVIGVKNFLSLKQLFGYNEYLHKKGENILQIINKFFEFLNSYITDNRIILEQKRDNNVILDKNKENTNFIYINNNNINNTIGIQIPQLLTYLEKEDKSKSLYNYTDAEYFVYNEYLLNRHLYPGYLEDKNIEKNINNMSQIIINAYNVQNINHNIKDEFFVYSVRHFVIIDSSPNGIFFTPEKSHIDQEIYFPFFISTSTITNFEYYSFLKEGAFIMKIKISKNQSPNNWIIVDEYSANKSEKEVIINNGSYFKITDVKYQFIKIGTNSDEYREIIVLEADLLPENYVPVNSIQVGGRNKIINTIDSSGNPNILLYDVTYNPDIGLNIEEDIKFQNEIIENIIRYKKIEKNIINPNDITNQIINREKEESRKLVASKVGGTINNIYKNKHDKYLGKIKNLKKKFKKS